MVEALHSLCTKRGQSFDDVENEPEGFLESRVLMQETYDRVREVEYNRGNALTRKSLTYLETQETKAIQQINRRVVKNLKKRFKTRNPYTLRVYRDEDQFEQILELENKM